MRGIFGKKQTDAILLILHHLWNGARDQDQLKKGV